MAAVLAALILVFCCSALAEQLPTKVEVTRTSLHVARSLDPDTTETLNVRTRTGEVASLIVKKRGGKSNSVPAPVSVTSSPMQVQGEDDPLRESKQLGVPAPVYVRSSPVYVKGQQQGWKRARGLISVDKEGIPVVTGVRMPDDESDRHVWRNARVINNVLVPNTQNSRDNTVQQTQNSQYSSYTGENIIQQTQNSPQSIVTRDRIVQQFQQTPTYFPSRFQQVEASPYYSATRDRILERIKTINARESVTRARMLRRSDTPPSSEFQARVLEYPTPVVQYPMDSTKQSRVSFEEGVRTPVLQYAHPELGVQVARKQDDGEDNEESRAQQEVDNGLLAYFAQDIHSDRSPYAYEPGVDNEEDKPDATLYDKRSQDDQDSYSYGLANDKYIRRYPYNGYNTRYNYNHIPTYGYKVEARPFWERFKEHVQTSMDKMSDLARPVVEPLVEATHKISHNLGLSSTSETKIQEKVGTAMATYPVLLPAIGLVAGGAALGLGAVAMGRYLDIDLMKRSNADQHDGEDGDKELSAEHKRALEQLVRSLAAREEQIKTEAAQTKEEGARHKVSRRSLDDNGVSSQHVQQEVPGGVADWGHTPCAKKIFCDVMIHQSTDNVILMEKKMATLLSLIQHNDEAVSFHLNDVMDAVKRRDCSAFTCSNS
ncbi:uncharacterized protein [Anabrus simplex]|uniref:uncharacterized protein n=1 Tax=Anabrus simplex TaxID=316456 RepID=UPI0035A3C400